LTNESLAEMTATVSTPLDLNSLYFST
jgi:hypothetical protein